MKYQNNKSRLLSFLLVIIIMSGAAMPAAALANQANNNESVIFTGSNVKYEDMRKKSDISLKDLTEYMKRFPYLTGIEEALINAQETYNVNLLFLLAVIRLESGNGKSSLAIKKNNLGGIRSSKSYSTFSSKEECIEYMAYLLSAKYLTEGGAYYKGYTIADIAKSYCVSDSWTNLVSNIMIEMQRYYM